MKSSRFSYRKKQNGLYKLSYFVHVPKSKRFIQVSKVKGGTKTIIISCSILIDLTNASLSRIRNRNREFMKRKIFQFSTQPRRIKARLSCSCKSFCITIITLLSILNFNQENNDCKRLSDSGYICSEEKKRS